LEVVLVELGSWMVNRVCFNWK